MSWDERFEVVIVGGGPGGATTAGLLAKRGRRALVLEADRFPRFHIGESLLPASAPVLAELGVTAELDRRFMRKYGAVFHDDRVPVADPASTVRYVFADAFAPAPPHAWQVTRAEFDDLLLRRARELGAEVRQETRVTAIVREGARVTGVVANGRRIGADVVVDATGRDALLAPTGSREHLPALATTAMFTNFRGGARRSGLEAGDIDIVLLAGDGMPGWAWFIPFADDTTSVGWVLNARALGDRVRRAKSPDRLAEVFADQVAASPWASRLLAGAERITPVRAAADYSFRMRVLAGDGWLAVGDAAGFLDPLFSTGAHLAMGGGAAAAEAIDRALATGDVSAQAFFRYERSLRAATDLFLGGVLAAYRGEVRPLLFMPNQRPVLRRTIASLLGGDVFHEGQLPAWATFVRSLFPATSVAGPASS